eukprot:g13352.t1
MWRHRCGLMYLIATRTKRVTVSLVSYTSYTPALSKQWTLTVGKSVVEFGVDLWKKRLEFGDEVWDLQMGGEEAVLSKQVADDLAGMQAPAKFGEPKFRRWVRYLVGGGHGTSAQRARMALLASGLETNIKCDKDRARSLIAVAQYGKMKTTTPANGPPPAGPALQLHAEDEDELFQADADSEVENEDPVFVEDDTAFNFDVPYQPDLKAGLYSASKVVGMAGVTAAEGLQAKKDYKRLQANMKTKYRMFGKRAELTYKLCQSQCNRMRILNLCPAAWFEIMSTSVVEQAAGRALGTKPKPKIHHFMRNAIAASAAAENGSAMEVDDGSLGLGPLQCAQEQVAVGGDEEEPIAIQTFPGDERDKGQKLPREPRVVFRMTPDATPFGPIKHMNCVASAFRSAKPGSSARGVVMESFPLESEATLGGALNLLDDLYFMCWRANIPLPGTFAATMRHDGTLPKIRPALLGCSDNGSDMIKAFKLLALLGEALRIANVPNEPLWAITFITCQLHLYSIVSKTVMASLSAMLGLNLSKTLTAVSKTINYWLAPKTMTGGLQAGESRGVAKDLQDGELGPAIRNAASGFVEEGGDVVPGIDVEQPLETIRVGGWVVPKPKASGVGVRRSDPMSEDYQLPQVDADAAGSEIQCKRVTNYVATRWISTESTTVDILAQKDKIAVVIPHFSMTKKAGSLIKKSLALVNRAYSAVTTPAWWSALEASGSMLELMRDASAGVMKFAGLCSSGCSTASLARNAVVPWKKSQLARRFVLTQTRLMYDRAAAGFAAIALLKAQKDIRERQEPLNDFPHALFGLLTAGKVSTTAKALCRRGERRELDRITLDLYDDFKHELEALRTPLRDGPKPADLPAYSPALLDDLEPLLHALKLTKDPTKMLLFSDLVCHISKYQKSAKFFNAPAVKTGAKARRVMDEVQVQTKALEAVPGDLICFTFTDDAVANAFVPAEQCLIVDSTAYDMMLVACEEESGAGCWTVVHDKPIMLSELLQHIAWSAPKPSRKEQEKKRKEQELLAQPGPAQILQDLHIMQPTFVTNKAASGKLGMMGTRDAKAPGAKPAISGQFHRGNDDDVFDEDDDDPMLEQALRESRAMAAEVAQMPMVLVGGPSSSSRVPPPQPRGRAALNPGPASGHRDRTPSVPNNASRSRANEISAAMKNGAQNRLSAQPHQIVVADEHQDHAYEFLPGVGGAAGGFLPKASAANPKAGALAQYHPDEVRGSHTNASAMVVKDCFYEADSGRLLLGTATEAGNMGDCDFRPQLLKKPTRDEKNTIAACPELRTAKARAEKDKITPKEVAKSSVVITAPPNYVTKYWVKKTTKNLFYLDNTGSDARGCDITVVMRYEEEDHWNEFVAAKHKKTKSMKSMINTCIDEGLKKRLQFLLEYGTEYTADVQSLLKKRGQPAGSPARRNSTTGRGGGRRRVREEKWGKFDQKESVPEIKINKLHLFKAYAIFQPEQNQWWGNVCRSTKEESFFVLVDGEETEIPVKASTRCIAKKTRAELVRALYDYVKANIKDGAKKLPPSFKQATEAQKAKALEIENQYKQAMLFDNADDDVDNGNGQIERPLDNNYTTSSCRHEMNRDYSPFWLQVLTEAFDKSQYVSNGMHLVAVDMGPGANQYAMISGSHTMQAIKTVGFQRAADLGLKIIALDADINNYPKLLEVFAQCRSQGIGNLKAQFLEALPILARCHNEYKSYEKRMKDKGYPPMDMVEWAKKYIESVEKKGQIDIAKTMEGKNVHKRRTVSGVTIHERAPPGDQMGLMSFYKTKHQTNIEPVTSLQKGTNALDLFSAVQVDFRYAGGSSGDKIQMQKEDRKQLTLLVEYNTEGEVDHSMPLHKMSAQDLKKTLKHWVTKESICEMYRERKRFLDNHGAKKQEKSKKKETADDDDAVQEDQDEDLYKTEPEGHGLTRPPNWLWRRAMNGYQKARNDFYIKHVGNMATALYLSIEDRIPGLQLNVVAYDYQLPPQALAYNMIVLDNRDRPFVMQECWVQAPSDWKGRILKFVENGYALPLNPDGTLNERRHRKMTKASTSDRVATKDSSGSSSSAAAGLSAPAKLEVAATDDELDFAWSESQVKDDDKLLAEARAELNKSGKAKITKMKNKLDSDAAKLDADKREELWLAIEKEAGKAYANRLQQSKLKEEGESKSTCATSTTNVRGRSGLTPEEGAKRAKSATGTAMRKVSMGALDPATAMSDEHREDVKQKIAKQCELDAKVAADAQALPNIKEAQRDLIIGMFRTCQDAFDSFDETLGDWLKWEAETIEDHREALQHIPPQLEQCRMLPFYVDAVKYMHSHKTILERVPSVKGEVVNPTSGSSPALPEPTLEEQVEATKKYLRDPAAKSPIWCKVAKNLNPNDTDGRGAQEEGILKLRHLIRRDEDKHKLSIEEEEFGKKFQFLKLKQGPRLRRFKSESVENENDFFGEIVHVHAAAYPNPISYLRYYWSFASNAGKTGGSVYDTDEICYRTLTLVL